MTQRISQAKLQRLHVALQSVISAVLDAKRQHAECTSLRPRLSGLSRFIRDLKSLPESSDYAPFEAQLKRRLVRAQHRIFGFNPKGGDSKPYGLVDQVPDQYHAALVAYDRVAHALLRALSNVNIVDNHQALASVHAIQTASKDSLTPNRSVAEHEGVGA